MMRHQAHLRPWRPQTSSLCQIPPSPGNLQQMRPQTGHGAKWQFCDAKHKLTRWVCPGLPDMEGCTKILRVIYPPSSPIFGTPDLLWINDPSQGNGGPPLNIHLRAGGPWWSFQSRTDTFSCFRRSWPNNSCRDFGLFKAKVTDSQTFDDHEEYIYIFKYIKVLYNHKLLIQTNSSMAYRHWCIHYISSLSISIDQFNKSIAK